MIFTSLFQFPWSDSHGDAGVVEILFGAFDAVLGEVVDVRRTDGVGPTLLETGLEVRPISGPSANQNGHVHRIRHPPAKIEIVSLERSIPLDRIDKDLAAAALHAVARPTL